MVDNSKYSKLVYSVLTTIREELLRLYWNKYQQPLNYDPFENTSGEYENETFSVRSYYWGDEEDLIALPNFQYKDFKVSWYKYYTRELEISYDKELTADFLQEMLDDCMAALRKDFGEEIAGVE